MKSSAGLETVDVHPDTRIVDLSIAVGKPCSWKTLVLAYCCDADDLWSHRRIAIHVFMGAEKGIRDAR